MLSAVRSAALSLDVKQTSTPVLVNMICDVMTAPEASDEYVGKLQGWWKDISEAIFASRPSTSQLMFIAEMLSQASVALKKND